MQNKLLCKSSIVKCVVFIIQSQSIELMSITNCKVPKKVIVVPKRIVNIVV